MGPLAVSMQLGGMQARMHARPGGPYPCLVAPSSEAVVFSDDKWSFSPPTRQRNTHRLASSRSLCWDSLSTTKGLSLSHATCAMFDVLLFMIGNNAGQACRGTGPRGARCAVTLPSLLSCRSATWPLDRCCLSSKNKSWVN